MKKSFLIASLLIPLSAHAMNGFDGLTDPKIYLYAITNNTTTDYTLPSGQTVHGNITTYPLGSLIDPGTDQYNLMQQSIQLTAADGSPITVNKATEVETGSWQVTTSPPATTNATLSQPTDVNSSDQTSQLSVFAEQPVFKVQLTINGPETFILSQFLD